MSAFGGAAALFLAWSPPSHTRRSALLARGLGIPLRRVSVLKMRPYLAPLRYTAQAGLTLAMLLRERPALVFVQNPPIFGPLCAWLYCAAAGAGLVIDSHTAALLDRVWQPLLPLHRFLSRRALATLLTNEHLAQMVAGWGARAEIVVDVPSEFPQGRPYPLAQPFNLAVVSSFAPDEPLEALVEAAGSLPQVGFYVTGNPARAPGRLPDRLPPNLHLTGFLPEEDFYGLLRAVDGIAALTTRDHTMQRGACEAVWLGQPIVTSDWPLLRQAFHRGTLHVDNSARGIRDGVLQLRARRPELAREIVLLQAERRQQWEENVNRLETLALQIPRIRHVQPGVHHELPVAPSKVQRHRPPGAARPEHQPTLRHDAGEDDAGL